MRIVRHNIAEYFFGDNDCTLGRLYPAPIIIITPHIFRPPPFVQSHILARKCHKKCDKSIKILTDFGRTDER